MTAGKNVPLFLWFSSHVQQEAYFVTHPTAKINSQPASNTICLRDVNIHFLCNHYQSREYIFCAALGSKLLHELTCHGKEKFKENINMCPFLKPQF